MENISHRIKNVDWNNIKKQALKVRGEAASKLKDFCMTDIENKVRAATSNKSWGASTSELFEISQSTFNNEEYPLVMAIVWQRLNDHGRHWRHVYKALELLRYLLMHGSSRVMDEVRDAIYHIQSLQDFRYIDPVTHKDEGANVRIKAKQVVDLVTDERLLQEERQKSKELYLKVANGGGASRFGGISSYDISSSSDYSNDRQGLGVGSDAALGGRYRNAYTDQYSLQNSSPIDSRMASNLTEEKWNTPEEPLGYYPLEAEHISMASKSSTLPGAVRLGSSATLQHSVVEQNASFASAQVSAKKPQPKIDDLISWDDTESTKTDYTSSQQRSDMIQWDDDFDPRSHEHSIQQSIKNSSMTPAADWRTNTLGDNPSTSTVKEEKQHMMNTSKNTTAWPENNRNHNNIIGKKDNGSSVFQSKGEAVPIKNIASHVNTQGHAQNKTATNESDTSKVSSAQSSVDPFGNLVHDLMNTHLPKTQEKREA
eukprot:jgi/Galph1/1260/GphlegSOOS_G5923.1